MHSTRILSVAGLVGVLAIFVSLALSLSAEQPAEDPKLRKLKREMDFAAKHVPLGNKAIRQSDFHPDGRHLATEFHGDISIWDIKTGKEIVRLSEDRDPLAPSSTLLAFGPDGKILAVLRENGNMIGSPGEINLWDWQGRKKLKTFIGHTGMCSSCCFSPDSRFLATGLQKISLWDVAAGKIIRRFPDHLKRQEPSGYYLSTRVRDLQFSPDGKRLAGAWANVVRIWDVKSGEQIRQFSCEYKWGDEWCSGRFSSDLKWLVTINRKSANDFFVKLWDVGAGKAHGSILWELPHDYWVYSPDGLHVLRVDKEEHNIQFWDIHSKKMLWFARPPFRIDDFTAIDLRTSRVLECGNEGTFKLWKIVDSDK